VYLLDAVVRGDSALLVLVDLSSAFDTMDHDILQEQLCVTFDVKSSPLQLVRCGSKHSRLVNIICGVCGPQTDPFAN